MKIEAPTGPQPLRREDLLVWDECFAAESSYHDQPTLLESREAARRDSRYREARNHEHDPVKLARYGPSMRALPAAYMSALRVLVTSLPLADINWALTGSTAHAIQGVPVELHDIDVQTDEAGASKAAAALADYCVTPPSRVESDSMRSLLGAYVIAGIDVELIGAVQKRYADGRWGLPTDPADYRRFVQLGDLALPVLDLDYEAAAYAQLGRHDRAELLRQHADPL
ncbi:MAG TPA: hypothetical protein VIZ32_15800 [Vicinamibacterales bacterium]